MPLIPVLSRHRHPRLRYVLGETGRSLGYRFQLITDVDKWEKVEAIAKISFWENHEGVKSIQLLTHPFLSGSAPTTEDLKVSWEAEIPFFFSVYDATGSGYDLFSMIFFCLSRYEEYGHVTADVHGRFPAAESHAQQNEYLQQPVVLIWAHLLAARLREAFPELPAPEKPDFTFLPTYDIDLLWAWHLRSLRGVGAGIKDLLTGNFRRAWDRFTVPAGADPYLVVDALETLHQKHHLQPLYFWLLADNTDYRDPNPYPIPPAQKLLMQQLDERWINGIHPGYRSMEEPDSIREESARLAEILGHATSHSRQHFLRFRLPATYRDLRLAGITHDYSMGYADAVGWRAGTNRAFNWYDVEKEKQTSLLVHPFAAMDVTLKNYLQLSAAAAEEQVLKLAGGVREFGGPFMLLWHNSSFAVAYGWGGWREMYEQLAERLASPGQTYS